MSDHTVESNGFQNPGETWQKNNSFDIDPQILKGKQKRFVYEDGVVTDGPLTDTGSTNEII